MDYHLYFTLKNFKDNFKDYFSKNVKNTFYTDYLLSYWNKYEELLSDLPYKEIILSEELDLIEHILHEEYMRDEQDFLSLLPKDKDNYLDFKGFTEELFHPDFEFRVFDLYDNKTAIEIKKALGRNDTELIYELTENYEEEFETDLLRNLEKQSSDFYSMHLDNNEDDINYEKYEEEYNKLYEKLESEQEKRDNEISENNAKRMEWVSKLIYKDQLKSLVEETCKVEFTNIKDFIEHELDLEFERKKQHTDPNKDEAEPLTQSQVTKIGLLIQSGIVDFLRCEYPKISNNQIAGFFDLISQERLKQKSTNTHFSKDSSKYPIQTPKDEEDLNIFLLKYGMKKK
jgi:hypothetical protein